MCIKISGSVSVMSGSFLSLHQVKDFY